MVTRADEYRTLLALCGAAGMVLICLYQRHIVLDFGRPESFERLFQHHCGHMLLAALLWMGIEVAHLVWRIGPGSQPPNPTMTSASVQ